MLAINVTVQVISGSLPLIRRADCDDIWGRPYFGQEPLQLVSPLEETEEALMSTELFWLTLTAAMTGLMWVPYIIDRIMVRGLMGTMDNPSPQAKPQSAWALRLYFAHTNAVENLVVFATLVLIANTLEISNHATVLACAFYFWARLAHAVVYTLGAPVLRTLAFTVAFAAQVVLVLAIFRLV
jgi:uncharacterized MAPEG superfamily protein